MNIDVKGYEGTELAAFMNGYEAGYSKGKTLAIEELRTRVETLCDERRDCDICPMSYKSGCIQYKVVKFLRKEE